MKVLPIAAACAVLALGLATATEARKQPPKTWDDLVLVTSKSLDLVYLKPGADFRRYTKIMLEPTEVAFREDWIRDYNSTVTNPSRRLNQDHADRIVQDVKAGMTEVFTKAYRDAGYQLVTAPGPDVLKVHTFVVNLAVTAPDIMTAGRTRTYAQNAGEASFGLEARDSTTNALLGRAVDSRTAGNSVTYIRNSVTNRADFHRMFQDWAKASVNGLNALKSGQAPQPR